MMQKSLHVRISPCVLNIFYKKLFGNDILPSCHTPLHPLYAFLTTGVNKQKKRANRLVCGALLCMVGICITDYFAFVITKLTLIVSTASSMLSNTAFTAAASVVSSKNGGRNINYPNSSSIVMGTGEISEYMFSCRP